MWCNGAVLSVATEFSNLLSQTEEAEKEDIAPPPYRMMLINGVQYLWIQTQLISQSNPIFKFKNFLWHQCCQLFSREKSWSGLLMIKQKMCAALPSAPVGFSSVSLLLNTLQLKNCNDLFWPRWNNMRYKNLYMSQCIVSKLDCEAV